MNPEDPLDDDRVVVTADAGDESLGHDARLAALVARVGDGRHTVIVGPRQLAAAAAARTGARWVERLGEGRDHDVVDAPVGPDDTALDDLHAESSDPWGVDSRWYERRKRSLLLAMLPRETFRHGLEVGSSTGALAEDLAARCQHLLVVDASAHAVAAARTRLGHLDHVRVEHRSVPSEWPEAPAEGFDLVVLSEVGYFLSPVALDELVARIRADLADDGVLVLCHWRHEIVGWPLDGADVHRVVAESGVRPVSAEYRDRDVELLVLSRADELPDPAS